MRTANLRFIQLPEYLLQMKQGTDLTQLIVITQDRPTPYWTFTFQFAMGVTAISYELVVQYLLLTNRYSLPRPRWRRVASGPMDSPWPRMEKTTTT